MDVLVTRPEPDGERTAARLRDMGHRPHLFPALRVVFGEEPAGSAPPAGLVVTSANGVRAAARWGAASGWRRLPLFAVGATSADAARKAGFANVVSADGNVADLAGLVARTFDPGAGTLLYPAARDRSGDFAGLVAAHGIAVATVEAYRAAPADAFDPATRALLQGGVLDALLTYSRRSSEVVAGLLVAERLPEALAGVQVLAISTAAAAPFRGVATAGVSVAARPNEDDLLAFMEDRRPRDIG